MAIAVILAQAIDDGAPKDWNTKIEIRVAKLAMTVAKNAYLIIKNPFYCSAIVL